MKQLADFENKIPEIVFEWTDSETDAKGWLVIDSLQNGACGGGTRMRKGLDKNEVIALAKTMKVKFAAIGENIGGAKSGINFDPQDPRKKEILKRWYKAIKPTLKYYYGTGGDLNVDEIKEVIPLLDEIGVLHPQEGTLRGLYGSLDDKTVNNRIKQLQAGVSKTIEDPNYAPIASKSFKIADMITGYGVAEAVKNYYKNYQPNAVDKKVIIQGWGNVGAAAGYYLASCGYKIVAIVEYNCALVKPKGFTFLEIEKIFIERKNFTNLGVGRTIPAEKIEQEVYDKIAADIFIPAAASRVVKRVHLDSLMNLGLELIVAGANVPFADPEIFYGPTCRYADEKISVIPDFVANCGMAETFWYLERQEAEITDAAIFGDIAATIARLINRVHTEHKDKTHLTKVFLKMFI
jgi:glutamate dehydrogenase/leucine dehydrogenase